GPSPEETDEGGRSAHRARFAPFVDLSVAAASRSGLDELEFEVDLDLVGHEELTADEDGGEGHAEVLAVDRAGRRQSGALVAVRVGGDTGEFGRERDFLGHSAQRQLADDFELLCVIGLDRGRLELQLRMLLGEEEVSALEVAVALLVPGADRGGV